VSSVDTGDPAGWAVVAGVAPADAAGAPVVAGAVDVGGVEGAGWQAAISAARRPAVA
jgi:hypothetical protein